MVRPECLLLRRKLVNVFVWQLTIIQEWNVLDAMFFNSGCLQFAT